MNAMYCVVIPGDPYGKGSPRAVRIGPGIRLHPPKADLDYAKRVEAALSVATYDRITDPRAPIAISIVAYMARTRSHLLKGGTLSSEGRKWLAPTKKPDVDNISKIVLDCFTRFGVWPDDAQVVEETLSKLWCDDFTPEPQVRVSWTVLQRARDPGV